MSGLKDISFHTDLDPPSGPGGLPPPPAGVNLTPEAIARSFLDDSISGIASFSGQDELVTLSTTEAPTATAPKGTTFVAFQQTHSTIPIFGACTVVTLDGQTPVAATGRTAAPPGFAPMPTLSEDEAVAKIGGTSKPEKVEVVYFHETKWHLAYHVLGIVVPRPTTSDGHGPGGSPRADSQLRNVLVDAEDGAILMDYSATPLVNIPSWVNALDDAGLPRTFFTKPKGDAFELRDPLNTVATYDANDADISLPRPADPVTAQGGDWGGDHRAAVSAHYNAIVVLKYFRDVFNRTGLDGKNTELTSIVRSTYNRHDKPPVWRNAVWWKGAMWYGQEQVGDRLVSFATRLEIAAHEMTHGLIEKTAGLIYRNESGALNESFSDIFGVIVANSTLKTGEPVANWDWVIGRGLGAGGKDIRDFRDPARVGYPGHYKNYDPTPSDNGGVHINSNIHNKAAYNLLTATDAGGSVFEPNEVALLYYYTLLQLGTTSTFRDALKALVGAAATLYKAIGTARPLAAIKQAYGDAGIEV